MVKILHTGDIHLGRLYRSGPPEVAEQYAAARMRALENAVSIGNGEGCGFLVVAGDLFDRTRNIPAALLEGAARALGEFHGTVLVLPGNHDFYDPDTDVLWKTFQEYAPSNTHLFKENGKYVVEDVAFYPCICHAKRSDKNALGWLDGVPERGPEKYHVGIAHGALEGISPDKEQNYFYMTRQELLGKHMDVWLLGHTHMPYPAVVDNTAGQRIFNAGTPQQTDIADHSAGEVFVIGIGDDKKVTAEKRPAGVVRFVRKEVAVRRGQPLAQALDFPDLEPASTSLRVELSGVACAEDYENRGRLYGELARRYLFAEVRDDGLRKEITPQMIDQEAVDGSLLNKLLHSYEGDMELLDLAYDLMLACKEGD